MRLPKLRTLNEYTVPKGIDINGCNRVALNIDGVKISFLAPPHRPVLKEEKPIFSKKEISRNDARSYISRDTKGRWRSGVHFSRSFAFSGPVFTGAIAELGVDLVFYNTKLKRSSETAFNPGFLEHSLFEILTLRYSDQKSYWASSWRAPFNWCVRGVNGAPSVSYDTARVHGGGDFFKEYAFPIFDDVFVLLRFREVQMTNGSLEQMDKLISREPLDQLANDIIKSVQVELPEEAKQQLARARQEFPNVQLSQDVQPLKWTTEEEDRKHAEYLANPENY
ncbi:MAG: hypothetical protein K6L76_01525 [Agarilytica sp.]